LENPTVNIPLQKVKHSKLAEDIERLVNDDKQMLPADIDGDNVSEPKMHHDRLVKSSYSAVRGTV